MTLLLPVLKPGKHNLHPHVTHLLAPLPHHFILLTARFGHHLTTRRGHYLVRGRKVCTHPRVFHRFSLCWFISICNKDRPKWQICMSRTKAKRAKPVNLPVPQNWRLDEPHGWHCIITRRSRSFFLGCSAASRNADPAPLHLLHAEDVMSKAAVCGIFKVALQGCVTCALIIAGNGGLELQSPAPVQRLPCPG